jgi:hypothetical protein
MPDSKSGATNDYRSVADFLANLTSLCVREDITIIGVMHSPKMKEDEAYGNPRQRISGSVAWAAYCETVVLVEPVSPDDPNSPRRLLILPRNISAVEKTLKFGWWSWRP